MLNFLENNLKLDASGLTIGVGSSSNITYHLTLDQTSTVPATFTIVVDNTAFSATLVKLTAQDCLLTITFDQPLTNLEFNVNHPLTITANTGDTFILNVEINYANDFSLSNWSNSADVISIADIDQKGPLTSLSLNNKLRSILTNAINALNQARLNTQYYFFKQKYLSDIIEFAIEAGSTLEVSSGVISYNSDGTISSIIKTYDTGRNRNQKIQINYTYSNFNITRIQKRGATQTPLETTSANLITGFTINALNNTGNIIYSLGSVIINRTTIPNLYSIPYLLDYVDTGNPVTDAIVPDNIMADYKYYQTNTITGWTITV